MLHRLPSILLAMLFRINQGQMGLQEEELESSIVTLFKYPNCLMKKEDHLNTLNGKSHGTIIVWDCALSIINLIQPPTLSLMPPLCKNLNHTLTQQCWSKRCCASLVISTYILMIQMTHMVVSSTICCQVMVLLTMSPSQHIKLVTLLTWLLHEIIKSWNLDQSSLVIFCLITVLSVLK